MARYKPKRIKIGTAITGATANKYHSFPFGIYHTPQRKEKADHNANRVKNTSALMRIAALVRRESPINQVRSGKEIIQPTLL